MPFAAVSPPASYVFLPPVTAEITASIIMLPGPVSKANTSRGFAPAGMELEAVSVDGQKADWGWQGTNESALRISCALEPGAECAFEMRYYVLLGSNRAFLGQGDMDIWAILKTVKDAGYDKEVSIEFEGMEDCVAATDICLKTARYIWDRV